MAIGHHKIEYKVLEGWKRLPEGWSFTIVGEVVVASCAVKRLAPLPVQSFQKFIRSA